MEYYCLLQKDWLSKLDFHLLAVKAVAYNKIEYKYLKVQTKMQSLSEWLNTNNLITIYQFTLLSAKCTVSSILIVIVSCHFLQNMDPFCSAWLGTRTKVSLDQRGTLKLPSKPPTQHFAKIEVIKKWKIFKLLTLIDVACGGENWHVVMASNCPVKVSVQFKKSFF